MPDAFASSRHAVMRSTGVSASNGSQAAPDFAIPACMTKRSMPRDSHNPMMCPGSTPASIKCDATQSACAFNSRYVNFRSPKISATWFGRRSAVASNWSASTSVRINSGCTGPNRMSGCASAKVLGHSENGGMPMVSSKRELSINWIGQNQF